ncbi:P-loop containing nucleoside triphosphate hydrolase protein [Wilcoxina mikolae CBS 423.85]|nr:P-loop containing nucleoside triphosphate hydrolase protein [Wilcoxina mikolae CBS 423.85]
MEEEGLTFETFDNLFKSANGEQEHTQGGLRCELKTFEARYNSKGERVVLSVGSRKMLDLPQDRAHDSALVLTKFYDKEKELEYTELEIRSPHVKAALKETVPEYHELNIQAKSIVLHDQPKCLFHYRLELQEYGKTLRDTDAVQHLVFALRYMYNTLKSEIYSYYKLFEMASPSIDFLNLWIVIRPGDYIYTKAAETERVLKFRDMTRCKCQVPWCENSRWALTAEHIDYDGTNFGYVTVGLYIRPYDGYKALADLNIVPLLYHPNKDSIIKKMVARGKKFISLHGIHHRMYEGIAEALGSDRRSSLLGEEDEFPLQSTLIKGRIMVDAKTFALARPSHQPFLTTTRRIIRTETDDHLDLKDDDYLICHHLMPGFSLVEKKWCFFEVYRIKDIEYNVNAFNTLMLEEEQKQMILSLVRVHADERLSFDDVIKGKGRGMIFLLHGVPGVGKTLTAESVADHCKRPLFHVCAGDLGASSSSVEQGLGDALQLATTWNAIILIDEADVFLERRSVHDLERNGLVSVFLRVLEYYEGIMFLTTNRIGSFDAAFTSRIHLAIKYPALTHCSRWDLWETFISKASPVPPIWMNRESLNELASENLNGRQIKNIVRTAHALAVSQNSEMNLDHIDMAMRALKTFEKDFAEDMVERRAEEGSSVTGERPSKRQRMA